MASYPAHVDGDYVQVSPTCLSTPSGNFVTDEEWLIDNHSTLYWVEAGYLQEGSGLNIGGITSAGRYGFWADNRPGGGFHAHVLVTNPSLNYTVFDIWPDGSHTWGAQFGSQIQYSTNNTMSPSYDEYGSESTSNSSHSCSFARYAGYATSDGVTHSGMVNPTTLIQSPQQFHWIGEPTSYNAGIAC